MHRRTLPRFPILLLALTLTLSTHAQSDTLTLYRNATLIDGTALAPQPNMSILVRDERIDAIAPSAQLTPPPNTKIIDATGLYVLPGLINTHIHIATDTNRAQALALMRRDLFSGITAERDMAGDTRQLAELARVSLLNEVPGPDIVYAALMAGPSFFKDPRTHAAARRAVAGDVPWMKAVTPQTDLHLAIAEAKGTGATAIKIYADLPADLVAAITKEAHSQGLLVWAHATVFPANAAEVVDAGVDSVSHAPMLAIAHPTNTYAESHVHPALLYIDGFGSQFTNVLDEMKSHHTILDATLLVFKESDEAHARHPQPNAVSTLDIGERATHAAYEAGIPISTGTDTEDEDNPAWSPLRDELLLLQDGAGMKPADVIRAATAVGARTLGQEKNMGTVEPGKLANLAFFAKNPLDGAQAFSSVVLTVKRGHQFWRKDFQPTPIPGQPKP
ncbi:MAG: amidohydrolase family protein [Terracidiphilus sp.]|jgi:imidazolonepropionase-like amidohydrolase